MNIAVIGGGPSGMMAAISASKSNNKVFLIEQNEKLGKKMFITGKGRCNFTNACDNDEFFNNIITNKKFMYSSYSEFNNEDTINFFNDNGLKTKIERGNRVFPESDKSSDVIDTLKNIIKKNNVKVLLNTKVIDINIEENSDIENANEDNNVLNEIYENNKNNIISKKVKSIELYDKNTNKKSKLDVDKVIIATGGFSYQSTGSTGDGYEFASKLGIKVNKISPSLVPLICEEQDELNQISPLLLKNVKIKLYKNDNKKVLYEDFGEINIRDSLLDGPIIISMSSIINIPYDIDFKNNDKIKKIIDTYENNNDKYYVEIDLKPAISHEELDERLKREILEYKTKKIYEHLKSYMPMKLYNQFIKRLNVDDKNLADLTKDDRKKIINLLKSYKYNIVKKAGFNKAIITHGGIDVCEVNNKTMECKKIKGLYFAGEVVDIDCFTGGFNMQCAFSMGYKAGNN